LLSWFSRNIPNCLFKYVCPIHVFKWSYGSYHVHASCPMCHGHDLWSWIMVMSHES
jgi:hypothetical protein